VEVPSLQLFQIAGKWPRTTATVEWWMDVMPDSRGHLEELPLFVKGYALFRVMHNLRADPRCFHMWLCFFGGVTEGKSAVYILINYNII
jgi:hypothetical protein